MNERIRELAKEAAKWVCENEPRSLDDDDLFDSLTREKFAELIVRECAGIVQPYMSRWPEDCDLVVKIKEHFGVEE